jgi:hypothetical protein
MIKKLLLGWGFALAFLAMPTGAAAAECTLYEQSHPAFLLDGAHLSAGKCSTCASCHRGGVFIGTPKSCVACHNGDPARVTVGRSLLHIPTSTIECSSCHNTTSYTATWSMSHPAVSGQRCDTCHSGSYVTGYNAQARSNTHVPIGTMDCVSCHTTTNWTVDHATIHAGITTGCVSCHNGTNAIGKINYAPGHPVTSDACETCHSIDAQFKCASAIDNMLEFFATLFNKAKEFTGTMFA